MNDPDFPDDSWVEVRYPLPGQHLDRSVWQWLPGWVAGQCGPGEWEICVQAPEVAMEHDGETVYPVCFRDATELRPAPEPKEAICQPPDPEAAG